MHKKYASNFRGNNTGYTRRSGKYFSRNIEKYGSYRTQFARWHGDAYPKWDKTKNKYHDTQYEDIEHYDVWEEYNVSRTKNKRVPKAPRKWRAKFTKTFARADWEATRAGARRSARRQLVKGFKRVTALAAKRIASSIIWKALMMANDLYMVYQIVTESYNALDYAIRRDFHYWDVMRENASGNWGRLSTEDHDWMQEAATGPKPERWVYNSDDGHTGQWYLGEPTDEEIRNQFKWLRDKKNGHWIHHEGWEHQEWIVDKRKKHTFIGKDSYKRLHGRN